MAIIPQNIPYPRVYTGVYIYIQLIVTMGFISLKHPIGLRCYPINIPLSFYHYYPTTIPSLSRYYPIVIPLSSHYDPIIIPLLLLSNYYPRLENEKKQPKNNPPYCYPIIIPSLSHYGLWLPFLPIAVESANSPLQDPPPPLSPEVSRIWGSHQTYGKQIGVTINGGTPYTGKSL